MPRSDYDRRRPPLEVFALNAKMNRVTGSIPYASLAWQRRYHECGQFQMVVPANVYDPSWAYVYADDRPETGIVQKVVFSDSAKTPDGIDTVIVSGFFLECILNRVTFLAEQPVTETHEIAIPKPSRPTKRKDSFPDVYQDPVGNYWYEDSSGTLTNATTGVVIDSTDGLTEVDYYSVPGSGGGPDAVASNYDYQTSGDKSTIHVVDWNGNESTGATGTFDVEFVTDKGDTFYYDRHGLLRCAWAVAERSGNSYFAKKRAWERSGGVRYETVTVKGPWQRTDMMEPVTEADPVQTLVTWVQRMVGNDLLYEEPTISAPAQALDPSFQLLGDLAYATLRDVAEASFRIVYTFENDSYMFSVWRGKDRMQEQTHMPWAVFSDTWGTIYEYTASRDESNYRNTCYVLYDYEEPNSFDEHGQPVVRTEIIPGSILVKAIGYRAYVPSHKVQGYATASVAEDGEPTIETYLDLRSERPSCDGYWSRDAIEHYYSEEVSVSQAESDLEEALASSPLVSTDEDGNVVDFRSTYEAFAAQMVPRGEQELRQRYPVVTSLDAGTVDAVGYMVDWDLGDKVEMAVSTVGLVTQTRITGVDEVYEAGKSEIRIMVGDEPPSVIDKARMPR